MSHAEELFTVPAWVLYMETALKVFHQAKDVRESKLMIKNTEIEKKRAKSVQNREFLTARSPLEDTMKTVCSRDLDVRYVSGGDENNFWHCFESR